LSSKIRIKTYFKIKSNQRYQDFNSENNDIWKHAPDDWFLISDKYMQPKIQAEREAQLNRIKNISSSLVEKGMQCPKCGFKLNEPDWRCPNCYHEFDSDC